MTDPTDFDVETAVRLIDADRYVATMAHSWWVARGRNGGYLAAVILRALAEPSVTQTANRARSQCTT